MDSVFVMRLFLVIIFFCIIVCILKINRAIKREKRIARYSLQNLEIDDLSIIDKIEKKYKQLLRQHENDTFLISHSTKYNRYLNVSGETSTVKFIINKLLTAICFVSLVIITYAIQGKFVNFAVFIISLIIGYYLYDIYLVIYTKNRKKKIKNDILRAVIIMNNAFKAGKSTLQAVEIASRDLPEPIATEFSRIYQDMSYGLSSDIAFERFAKRVGLEEANYISSSLTILNKTGGNIIMVFSSIERTLFDRKKLESDLKNSAAASNLVVKVLMFVPVFFCILIYVVSPTYFDPLFESAIGYFILFIVIVMFIVYIYLLNKIMKVKV